MRQKESEKDVLPPGYSVLDCAATEKSPNFQPKTSSA